MSLVVVAVVCASCADYGVCRSFFAKSFLSKIIVQWINSFPTPQCGFFNLFESYLTVYFVVSHRVLCKLWRNFRFFCSVNHDSGPLRKHMFTFTNWKGHGFWFMSSGVRSVLFVSCFSYQLGKCASQIFLIFLILVTCNNKATSLFFWGQKIHSPLHAWYFLFYFFN